MTFETYFSLFDKIISSEVKLAPYDKEDYLNYTKLNASRYKRWLKHGHLTKSMEALLSKIEKPLHFLIISEHWCGDAAHILPFIQFICESNKSITYDIELRDSAPFSIDKYLTNGGKSIPMVIVREKTGVDLFVWGPRPKGAQAIMDRCKEQNLEFEEIKIQLQKWYNENEGKEICNEFENLLKAI